MILRALAPLTAGLALTAVVGCSSGDGGSAAAPTSSAPTSSSAPAASPTTSATSAPAPSAAAPSQASAGGVVLGGEDLGVTRLGAPFREAVAAVSAVLGQPDEDPAETVSCIQSETEVRWGGLALAEQADRLAGWSSTSETLQTPSGVTVGTPLAELERIYGPSLNRLPANPDNPPRFAGQGVDVIGALSSAQDDATVTRLFTSFCAGP